MRRLQRCDDSPCAKQLAVLQACKRGDIRFPPSVSAMARDWVRMALVMDVEKRASVATLMRHPWIVSNRGGRDAGVPGGEASVPSGPTPAQSASAGEAAHPRAGNAGADMVRRSPSRFARLVLVLHALCLLRPSQAVDRALSIPEPPARACSPATPASAPP